MIVENNVLLGGLMREHEAVEAPEWVGIRSLVHKQQPVNLLVVDISVLDYKLIKDSDDFVPFESIFEGLLCLVLKVSPRIPEEPPH